MEKYIGIKEVKAKPMTAYEALQHGYKIGEHQHEDGYQVVYSDGYKSWSPKEVFEKSYKLHYISNDDFENEEYNGQSGVFKVDNYKNMSAFVGGDKDHKSKISIGTLNVVVNGKEEVGLHFIKCNREGIVNEEIDDFENTIDSKESSFVFIPHSKDSINLLIDYLEELKKVFE